MSNATYCYKIPLSLGSPYKINEKDEIVGYEYQLLVQDSKFGMKLLLPNHIGSEAHFSISIQESPGKLRRVRCGFYESQVIESKDREFQQIKNFNAALWSVLYPTKTTKDLVFNNIPSEILNALTVSKSASDSIDYSKMNLNILMMPTRRDKKRRVDIDTKLIRNFKELKKLSYDQLTKKSFQQVYISKEFGGAYLLGGLSLVLINSTLQNLIHIIHNLKFGVKFDPKNEQHNEWFLQIKESFGIDSKNIDVKSLSIIDFLFDIVPTLKRSDKSVSPLARFIDQFKNKEEVRKMKYLIFTMKANGCDKSEFNYCESSQKYLTNSQLNASNWGNKYTLLPLESLYKAGITLERMDFFNMIPSILVNVQRFAQVNEFRVYNDFNFISSYRLFKALSCRAFNRIINNETLETLGDTVLKTIVTLYLYSTFPEENEDFMTKTRASLINNNYLSKCGMENGIQFFLKESSSPVKNWCPPAIVKMAEICNIEERQVISDKMIADGVEAVIGAGFSSTKRLYEALQIISRFGILKEYNFEGIEHLFTEKFDIDIRCFQNIDKLITSKSSYGKLLSLGSREGIYSKYKIPFKMVDRLEKAKKQSKKDLIGSECIKSNDRQISFKNYFNNRLFKFEKKSERLFNLLNIKIMSDFERSYLGYVFKKKDLLKAAFRPYGKVNNNPDKMFNRLEFLGDAIIEVFSIALARHFYIKLKKSYCPEMLHSVKVILLSNEGLARIFMHLKLHRYLLTAGIAQDKLQEIYNFIQQYDPNQQFKELWWSSSTQVIYL